MDMTRRGFIGLFAKVTAAAATANYFHASADILFDGNTKPLGFDIISISIVEERSFVDDTAGKYMEGLNFPPQVEMVAYFNGSDAVKELSAGTTLKDFFIPFERGSKKGVVADFMVSSSSFSYENFGHPIVTCRMMPCSEITIV